MEFRPEVDESVQKKESKSNKVPSVKKYYLQIMQERIRFIKQSLSVLEEALSEIQTIENEDDD